MTPRYSAWLFVNPVLDPDGVTAGGPMLTATHGIAMVSEEASVRQAMVLLLSTIPGERVMRPDYGSYLHRLIFAPNDDTTAGLAIHYVRQALERWEPRIDILGVDAGAHPEQAGCLLIEVDYLVRATQVAGRLELGFDLAGGADLAASDRIEELR
jgi:phage baseplate assembly protein W